MNSIIDNWTEVVVNNITTNTTLDFDKSVSSRIFDCASSSTASKPLTRKQKRNKRNNAYNKRKKSWMNTSNHKNNRSKQPSTNNKDVLTPFTDITNNKTQQIDSSFSSSLFDTASTSTQLNKEPFYSNIQNIPDQLRTKKQKENQRTNFLKRLKNSKNNNSQNNRMQWDFVFKSNNFLCSRKIQNKECADSCAGSVYLEGSVNGIYLSDTNTSNKKPGVLENGEYEVDWMSVCTTDHKKFRTHWKGYENHTLEPRCHLRNAPVLVNAAIDKYNLNHTNKYKHKRAVLPNIPELLKINPLQCEICGKRESSEHRMNLHKEYIHEIVNNSI